ncbi:hypothetical protein Tco_0059355 [Tanacetum coccineum]
MNIGKDTTELSFVQQRLHGVSTTCQSYSPFNNSEHTCDSANVTSHHSFAYVAALASDIDSRTSCPTTSIGPMPVEVTTVAKQAFVELLEEDINIPAWLAFNSEDGVNVVSDDSLAEMPIVLTLLILTRKLSGLAFMLSMGTSEG